MMTSLRLAVFTFALSLLLVGCDEAPGVSGEMQPPVVSGFQYAPDSANGASVPVADSVARIPLDVFVSASDPDGQVDRVVFLLEPATAPQATFADTLRRVEGSRYGLRLDLGLPAFVDETYTLRVFAVDDDSLASNQAIGRLRYVPPPEATSNGQMENGQMKASRQALHPSPMTHLPDSSPVTLHP